MLYILCHGITKFRYLSEEMVSDRLYCKKKHIYIQGLEALAWQSYFLVLKNSSPTVLIYFLAHGDNLVLARTTVPMDCLTV